MPTTETTLTIALVLIEPSSLKDDRFGQEGSKAGASIEGVFTAGYGSSRRRECPTTARGGAGFPARIAPPHTSPSTACYGLRLSERSRSSHCWDAALLAALRDGMDDGRKNGEYDGRDPEKSSGTGGRAGRRDHESILPQGVSHRQISREAVEVGPTVRYTNPP